MSKNSGFTLMELMIALAILSVMAAVAVPNMLGSRAGAKLRGAVNNLEADLKMAKMLAVRENAEVVVNFTASGYQIFVDNGAGANAGDWIREIDERLFRDRQLPAGVVIDTAATDFNGNLCNAADPCTRFNARGLPDELGAVVLSDGSGEQRQIGLNRLGRVSVQ